MNKVFGIVLYELRPGVTEAQFDDFESKTDFAAFRRPGMTVQMVKGDRGKRKGRYAMIAEFDSVESRNQFFPVAGGGIADETLAALLQRFFEGLDKLVEPNGEWTDYVTMD